MTKKKAPVRFKILAILFAAVLLAALCAPLAAHHGFAAYDESKQLVMKATVTEWLWANPHCFLRFDATDDRGQVVHWAAEVSNPIDMTRRGWTKRTLNAGDQVTVTIRPAKNGAPIGQLLKVELANGQTLVGWNPGVR
jgi:hypothetical protein